MPAKDQRKSKGKGFKVGPRLAKGSYNGHTTKIKRTLIHKANVKRQYYKDLKAEGYGDDLATGANGGELGERRVKKIKPVLGEQRRGPVEEEEDDEAGEADEAADTAEDQQEESSSSDDDNDDSLRPRPSSSKGKGKARSRFQPLGRSKPPPRSEPSTSTSTFAQSAAAAPPARRPRLSEEEVAALREAKKRERREWAQRGARGQPKLGNRVEQLLGRIQRSMQN